VSVTSFLSLPFLQSSTISFVLPPLSLSLSQSSNGQPGLSSVLQTNTNSIQHDSENDNSVQKLLKRKSSRRKPRLWRKPVMNRSLALRPGTVQDTSCSVPAYTSHFLGTDRSTGTASFNQASRSHSHLRRM
jgi:hypothetical protein